MVDEEKPEGSPRFSIDKKGLLKVLKGAGIVGVAAALTYLLEAIPGINFGASTPAMVGMLSILINFARKWIMSYK